MRRFWEILTEGIEVHYLPLKTNYTKLDISSSKEVNQLMEEIIPKKNDKNSLRKAGIQDIRHIYDSYERKVMCKKTSQNCHSNRKIIFQDITTFFKKFEISLGKW